MGNTRGAQSVERPALAQVMILQFLSLSPASGSVLIALSLQPASDSVSPSLSAPLLLALCVSQKKKLKKIFVFKSHLGKVLPLVARKDGIRGPVHCKPIKMNKQTKSLKLKVFKSPLIGITISPHPPGL